MCLILFAYRVHSRYPLILAGNRDEFYRRPTASARFWEEAPALLAGRDLERGGTWLGGGRDGRIAAVTNYREPAVRTCAERSRGELVSGFLRGAVDAEAYRDELEVQAGEYGGFNLLFGSTEGLRWYSNRGGSMRVKPGVHGLSNARLDTPWPKVVEGRRRLSALCQEESISVDALFNLLADRTRYRDDLLPETGFDLAWERILSAAFILSSDYGTRASTVILIDAGGRVVFEERSFGPGGRTAGRVRQEFTIARNRGSEG